MRIMLIVLLIFYPLNSHIHTRVCLRKLKGKNSLPCVIPSANCCRSVLLMGSDGESCLHSDYERNFSKGDHLPIKK